MDGQTQSRTMALAFGALVAVGACALLRAAWTVPPTSLHTTTTSGVSAVQPQTVVSRSGTMGPQMGCPSTAAMPTSEEVAAVSTPIEQGSANSALRRAQHSGAAVITVGAMLASVSRFFKGPAYQPLAPMDLDLADTYGSSTGSSNITMAIFTADRKKTESNVIITNDEVLAAQKTP